MRMGHNSDQNQVADFTRRASFAVLLFGLPAAVEDRADSSEGPRPSRARHSASFFPRARLARKPNCRMRTNPLGRICSRKRRMNSTASSVMTLRLVAVRIVLPLESHAAAFHRQQPPIGDGNPMRVAGQILQNLLRSAKGRLCKDDPFDSPRLLAQGLERRPAVQDRPSLHETSACLPRNAFRR